MDFSDLPLRDIHLPETVSWFPPGPGVWALLLIGAAIVGLIVWLRRRTLSRAALAELSMIESRYRDNPNTHVLAKDLSVLVRRVALARASKQRDVAGLTGPDWLRYLARTVPALADQDVLLSAPYARDVAIDVDKLLAACRAYCAAGRRSVA